MMISKIRQPYAEIVQSSVPLCKAILWDSAMLPEHGELAVIDDGLHGSSLLIAVIVSSECFSLDQGALVQPYKLAPDELRSQYPELELLSSILITLLPIAQIVSESRTMIVRTPPPRIPQLHALVAPANKDEYALVMHSADSLSYMGRYVDGNTLSMILVALARNSVKQDGESKDLVYELMERVIDLELLDYRQIRALAGKLQQIVSMPPS